MPANSDPKTAGESQNPIQGLLAKCGISIPALSVRDSEASVTGPNRPVMFLANSKEKKRKRTARSPLSSARTPFKMAGTKDFPTDFPWGAPIQVDETLEEEEKEPEDKCATTRNSSVRAAINLALKDSAARKKYKDEHQRLLNQERNIAWDRKAMPEDPAKLTDDEQTELKAGRIVRAMREYEREMVFGNLAGEALPGEETLDMGGQFLTNKARIEERSKLYEIAKMAPKGALLHLHFNAELHPERLLEEARHMPNMYVRSLYPLNKEENLEKTEIVFNVMSPRTTSVDIFAEDGKYPFSEDGIYPGAKFKEKKFANLVWMRWADFRETFAAKFGDTYAQSDVQTAKNESETEIAKIRSAENCAEPGHVSLLPAENWIKQKMVLSKDEAYKPDQTVNGIWARFNQATRCFKGLLNYEKVYKWYIGQAIDRMIEEKVMYAELRPMLLDKSIPTDDGDTKKLTNRKQMRLIEECVKEKTKQLEDAGKLDTFPYGLKIVYCTPRSISPEMMKEEVKQCIELKLEFSDLICGFDLVGAEDRPNSIGFYARHLLAFRKTCEKLKLDIPFLFHAGETLLDTGGSKDPENSNLYAAQVLKSKRIGHGFSLLKHPHLVEKFRRKVDEEGNVMDPGICVELCPISNELLHLCRNVKEHPYPELLAAGIPCTINSDNPSLFSNSMSHEFYQVMVGAPTMSIYSWKQLAHWSIEYSCLSAEQRTELKEKFDTAWKTFCIEVVESYGGLMDGNKISEKKADEAYEVHKHKVKRKAP